MFLEQSNNLYANDRVDDVIVKQHFIENKPNCDNVCGSKFAGQSVFSFAYWMQSDVCSQELCEHKVTMEQAYQVVYASVARTQC